MNAGPKNTCGSKFLVKLALWDHRDVVRGSALWGWCDLKPSCRP